jgi:hypothetical protein
MKKPMLTFNIKYFGLTILLFVIEVLIALFIHDAFIRPYIGDFLVVILIYCFIKSFLNLPTVPVAGFVLLFSFGIEFLQYFNFVEKLGLGESKLATIILGNSFAWLDLVAYAAGIIAVVVVEKIAAKRLTG